MAHLRRASASSKINNDTGFGVSTTNVGGRFINKDGSFNMRKEGLPVWERYSIFHSMLNMPRWKFIAVVIIFYLSVNVIFSGMYYLIGPNEFQGMIAQTTWQKFKEIYFFSTETFTTVGYGRVNPVGDMANFVASIEAITGFLSLAIFTGLMYGRFSKPKPFLMFSENALVSPYRDKAGLMFRFASYKDNHVLTDVEVRVTVGFQVTENGNPSYKFYTLDLERQRADSLPMNFTVVHPLDENSPLLGFSADDMKNADVELYVLVRGFDNVYSNIVLQRTSYTYKEIRFNAKFVPMYKESDDKNTTILELQKLSEFIEVPLPVLHEMEKGKQV
ncbi:MAG: transporter [Bacteroidetes bacterium]|nr:transporter [Bacteroidota bacterium]MBS1972815.1 transporter [Bacteroidota bacterium]